MLRWEKAPYGIKSIFVDIPKGSQGAGRWSISPNGKGKNKRFDVKLNGVKRNQFNTEDEAKSWVSFEVNRNI